MLELAGAGPGQQVLDIATGIGEPALLAASRVGPTGRVVATDLSPAMLAIARQRAAVLRLTNVQFVEGDADLLVFPPKSFDTILCRWGVTSLPHPKETLITIHQLLKLSGVFVTAIWQEGAKGRPLASLAAAVIQGISGSPPFRPEAPSGARSAGAMLEQALISAGFRDVAIEEMALTLEFASPADCATYLKDVSPDLATALSHLSAAQQAQFDERLAEKLRPHVGPEGGVAIPNVTICGLGRP